MASWRFGYADLARVGLASTTAEDVRWSDVDGVLALLATNEAEALVTEEVSIGDYILTNGAIAANVFVDAVVRLLPGVLGDERSAVEDSFSEGLIEAPCYTRPEDFRGMKVPEILLSGHHAKIAAWKKEEGRRRTAQNRSDLLP